MTREFKRCCFLVIAFVSVVVTMLFFTAVDIASFSCAPMQRADVALVLGSSVRNGIPSEIFKGRLDTAIDLYKRKVVSSLLISGGVTRQGEPSEAYAGAQYVVAQGVPEAHVILEREARSTRDNLQFGVSEIARRGSKSWVVVSDPYHMRRVKMLAEEQGIGQAFQCVSVPHSSQNSISFLLNESRKVIFMRIP